MPAPHHRQTLDRRRRNQTVAPGGKMAPAMQLNFTPFIWRMIERRKRAVGAL
jgi:phosphoribulokinase